MKNIIIIIISIFILSACNKDATGPNNLEQILIVSGVLSGNGAEEIQQGNYVIENEFFWNTFITKMNTVNDESQNFTETEIDFDKFIILAVFDDVKSSGGHSVEIEELVEKEDAIEVIIKRASPSGIVTHVICQPYYISKIQKPNKDIVFKE